MADIGLDAEDVRRSLQPLTGGRGYFSITHQLPGSGVRSDHFVANQSGVDQALKKITEIDAQNAESIWARTNNIRELPPVNRFGFHERGEEGLAANLIQTFLDVDCGKFHKANDSITKRRGGLLLPGDEAAAIDFIEQIGFPDPSRIDFTGGGVNPYWYVTDPPDIDAEDTEAYRQAEWLTATWQDIAHAAGKRIGVWYGPENRDMARIMRVPGTVNRKKDFPVRQARTVYRDGPSYTYAELLKIAEALSPQPEPKATFPPPATPGTKPQDDAQRPQFSQPANAGRWVGGIAPGLDFRNKATPESVVDMLAKAGWTTVKEDTDYYYLKHPDATNEQSGTVKKSTKRLYVFTGSTVFPDNQEMNPEYVWALLNGYSSFTPDAARALRKLGYGQDGTRVDPPRPAPAGDPDDEEESGGTLPAPTNPMAVSRALVARMLTRRSWWRGDFYIHRGTHYDVVETSTIQNWIYQQTENARFLAVTRDGEEAREWAPTQKKVNDIVHAMGVGVLHRSAEQEADKALAVTNGVVDISNGQRVLLPHTADRFNLFSLPFAYDPDATCPQWLDFLESVLPGDRQSHEFLGEWFGYVLSGRTNLQKMAALIGEKRSGKGTIARVLGAMLGQPNVAGLDLNHIPTQFGLENLIGKALAVSGDVRWHSRQIGDAVPLLLRWIGEDVMDVHRKNRSTWNGQLGARIMMMSNDTPTFSDRSGALAGRMIYVKFNESFFGREDTSLGDKLMDELPGILNWALDGLDRLRGRGSFSQPESGLAEAAAVERLANPVGAFVDDWAHYDTGRSCWIDELLEKYQRWCEAEGRTKDSTTKEIFSKNIRAKAKADGSPLVFERKRRPTGGFSQWVTGIYSDVTPTTPYTPHGF